MKAKINADPAMVSATGKPNKSATIVTPNIVNPRNSDVILKRVNYESVLKNTRKLLPNAQIAVYRQNTNSDQIPEYADCIFNSLEDAVDFKPDAVIVSSPASKHMENSLPFLNNKIPLFIEKPLASSLERIDEIKKKLKDADSFIMVGYVLRFLPTLHNLKNLISNNLLGDIYTAHIEVGQYLPDWRPNIDYRTGVSAQNSLGGGALLELSHELDYATWLFGYPKSIIAIKNKLSNLDIDVEDTAHVLMQYSDKHVLVKMDFLQRVATMFLKIIGEKGNIEANLIKEEIKLINPDNPSGKIINNDTLSDSNEIYLRQFDLFFYKAFKEYSPIFKDTKKHDDFSTIEQAIKVLELVNLAKKSSDDGIRLDYNTNNQIIN